MRAVEAWQNQVLIKSGAAQPRWESGAGAGWSCGRRAASVLGLRYTCFIPTTCEKRLWSINCRLLNCTARAADAAATQVCACVPKH